MVVEHNRSRGTDTEPTPLSQIIKTEKLSPITIVLDNHTIFNLFFSILSLHSSQEQISTIFLVGIIGISPKVQSMSNRTLYNPYKRVGLFETPIEKPATSTTYLQPRRPNKFDHYKHTFHSYVDMKLARNKKWSVDRTHEAENAMDLGFV